MDIHVTVMKGHLILALFTAALIHNQAVKASPTHAHAQTSSSSLLRSVNSSLATYDCQGCLAGVKLRVLFLEGAGAVMNSAATEAANKAKRGNACGSCCANPQLAVPECFIAKNWNSGWVSKVMFEAWADFGIEIVALTPANYSAETLAPSKGSLFERCIWEVRSENVDLCVGTFWETPARRNLVQFTTPLEINKFVIVTATKMTEGAFSLTAWSAPFHQDVWISMVILWIVNATLMWILQSSKGENDFSENEKFPKPLGVMKGIWISMMGWMCSGGRGPGGGCFLTTRWSGRLVLLGYTFFMYISVATYTANLATFMILADRSLGQVKSLDDLVQRGLKICVHVDVEKMVTYPGLTSNQRLISNNFGPILERLKQGECAAAIVDQFHYTTLIEASKNNYVFCNDTTDANYMQAFSCVNQSGKLGIVDLTKCKCTAAGSTLTSCPEAKLDCSDMLKFCNMFRISDAMFDGKVQVNVALPATPMILPYLSSRIVSGKSQGITQKILQTEFWDNYPKSCPASTAQGMLKKAEMSDSRQVKIEDMAGVYLISGVCMLLGVMAFVVEKRIDYSESKKTKDGGQESDVHDNESTAEVHTILGKDNICNGSTGDVLTLSSHHHRVFDVLQEKVCHIELELAATNRMLCALLAVNGLPVSSQDPTPRGLPHNRLIPLPRPSITQDSGTGPDFCAPLQCGWTREHEKSVRARSIPTSAHD